MGKKKKNCWEYTKCGRQPGGAHEADQGACPAAVEARLDSVHRGKNGGRACWVVVGTFCDGVVQGSFAKKHHDCAGCDFYKLVEKEEGKNHMLSTQLLKKLKFG